VQNGIYNSPASRSSAPIRIGAGGTRQQTDWPQRLGAFGLFGV